MEQKDLQQYFRLSGLSYEDITIYEINLLIGLLDFELHASTKGRYNCNCKSMKFDYKNSMKLFENDGSLKYAELSVRSNYFEYREAITFFENREIKFCRWADDSNAEPIKRAFIRWVDMLKEYK